MLRELLRLYPGAQVFTLIDRMSESDRNFLGIGKTTTSFLNRLPGIERRYRSLLPLFPVAVTALDVSQFDIVISNSHAVAKGVRVHDGQLHLCYCLSPMRYAWDLREQYLTEAGLSSGLKSIGARLLLDGLKAWDRANTRGVDAFATLSHFIGDRIQRAYGRSSEVIYPPVDVRFFGEASSGRGDYYVTAGRFVSYKRTDAIAAAFRHLPDRRLIIIGDGPDRDKVVASSGANVTLLGRVSRNELRDTVAGARAFIFAAEEDFGIAPVEAQAAGVPVIAFGKGGATETVRPLDTTAPTGVFFYEQTDVAIAAAVRAFENSDGAITADACRSNASQFADDQFRRHFADFVERHRSERCAGSQLPASHSLCGGA